MLKLVIDTNVLIDASEDYYRYANRIIDLVIAGQIKAYANRGTLRENRLLVLRKITDEGYLKKLEYYFDKVRPVEAGHKLLIVADPQDSKILESAVNAKADYLITSDKHLLNIHKHQGVQIVRPAQFWSIWEEEGAGWQKWWKSFIG